MPPPLLEVREMTKRYPGVVALDGVSLDLAAGEILALVGENGAGKSTLVHILAGATRADGGQILLGGTPVLFAGPGDALRAGVGVIYQETRLVRELTVAENIMLGHEPATPRGGFLRKKEMQRKAAGLLSRLDARIDPVTPAHLLGPADAQLVAIARALSHRVRVLALDEPTAPLTPDEADSLLALLRRLAAEGTGILYISHRLAEVYRVAQRIAVLRDGRLIRSAPAAELTRDALIPAMVGRPMEREYPTPDPTTGGEILSINGLRSAFLQGITLTLHRGEVLGVAGLAGSGRTTLARTLFGAEHPTGGSMLLAGRPYAPATPHEAIAAGVALLTEDRNRTGLLLNMNVRENISLPFLTPFVQGPFISRRREGAAAGSLIADLMIKTPSAEQPVTALSGGNRQKVLLARWLLGDASVLIFDEPTAGVDVGARYELYRHICRLAEEGRGILLLSSDLSELVGICSRIAVLREGALAGVLERPEATPGRIMELATGARGPAA